MKQFTRRSLPILTTPSGDPTPIVVADASALAATVATPNAPVNPPASTPATHGGTIPVPTSQPATHGVDTPTFWQRHKHHIFLGGAVAVAVGAVAMLSGGRRDNPGCGCGPSCGCAPCRAKWPGPRPNPSRGRRAKGRGRKGGARR